MTPLIRQRIESNLDYHQALAEQYQQLEDERVKAETNNGDAADTGTGTSTDTSAEQDQPLDTPEAPAEAPEDNGQKSDFARIAEMHGTAAKLLRDLLAAQPPRPAIRQALTERTITRGMA